MDTTPATNSPKPTTQSWLKTLSMEVIVLLVGALAVALLLPSLTPKVAHAASDKADFTGNCFYYISQNCYGGVIWPNAVLGSISVFETVPLYSVNNGSDHISEEMWNTDTNHVCQGAHIYSTGSWIEAGEATRTGSTGNWYFWASCIGNHSTNIMYHWQYQPPSGDVYQYFGYQEWKYNGYFYIDVWNNNTGVTQWSGNVNSEGDLAQRIQIGLETTNNNYNVTHAAGDYFTDNEWEGNPDGHWHWQGNSGTPLYNNPPYWSWIYPPGQTNYGGFGLVTCC
jgi:hypothetical protein